MRMKKILVLLTGGTIGSTVQGKSMNVTEKSAGQLLSLYQKKYGREEEFEVKQPVSVLSENMTPGILGRLCSCMKEIPYENYQGVIIAHGSDTLSYTAALLGMYLGHVPVPVVLTAANYPLEDARSNGLVNFRSAVELIRCGMVEGVFAVYQSNTGEIPVYVATRLTEADAYEDQFRGFGGIPFGKMEKGQLILYRDKRNPTIAKLHQAGSLLPWESPSFSNKIMLIRPYPGLDYRFISLQEKPAAILHYLYHSATACTVEENYSFLKFLDFCTEQGIPVYTASYKCTEGRFYATTEKMMERGIIPMKNISLEAAYTKLLLLYNLGQGTLRDRMDENFYFESLPSAETE